MLREISIDHGSATPLYKQIYDSFLKLIETGKLKSGDKLPSTPTIAAALKVGPLTVDNALNILAREGLIFRRPKIGSFVKERDEANEAVETKKLKAVSNQLISVILCDIEKTDMYWHEIIKELELECSKKGFGLLFSTFNGDIKSAAVTNLMGQTAGTFLCGKNSPELTVFLQENNKPVCLIGDLDKKGGISEGIDIVAHDDIQRSYLTAKHLLALGHKRIAYVGGPFSRLHHLNRLEGHKKALAEFNVNFDDKLVFPIKTHSVMEGEKIALKLFAKRDQFTAISTSDDRIAVGIAKKANECGIKIPEEFSISGCGDLEIARVVTPAITTIQSQTSKTVKVAVTKLLKQIKGKANAPCRTVLASSKLIARASTGKLS